ncbi:MAG: histidine phosphatase family protein [Blautia sp.]|nr:histidine phosphatase family protein [Blautia sp.]MCM1202137.1 histidine phosphatase family protein [Bacteroides fragilis]
MRHRTEDQITLVMLRHGETRANRERRYLGKTDESLSENGIGELRFYKERQDYPAVEYLFASPMKRCLETARILYPALRPVVIPEWEEIDFGEFEYKNYEELRDDARYQAWIDSGGILGFPGGESREAFLRRCENGFDRMCGKLRQAMEQNAGSPVRAGLVVHGGTIMALLDRYGGKPYFDCQAANGRGYLCLLQDLGNCARIKEVSEL